MTTTPILSRFLQKVDKDGPNGCWLWLGSMNQNGYGHFCVQPHKPVGAHRVSLMLFRGIAIVRGHAMTIDHLCRNRRCVNPDHLEYVTQRENTRRAMRARKPETHCRNGHEYTDENTYWYRGRRSCRACHADVERRRRSAIVEAGGQ